MRISTNAAMLILMVLVAIALLWTFLHKETAPQIISTSATSTVAASDTQSTLTQPPNTNEYQSNVYQFSLYYPDDLAVSKQPGAAGSIVVLFQDQSNGQGFDIFIVPYDEPKITQATFLLDEPSGVMNDPIDITVDGAPATEFISTNQAMGASVEMWFLHEGFLYEVTAPQPLASWLLQIMGTWQFT